MEATTEWKMGVHTLQPHSLGTGVKCPHPKFPSFILDWEGGGGTNVFYPPQPDYIRIVGNPISSR